LSGIDLPERVCSDHISSLVNLKWTLPATETQGIAKLRGISLSPTMLDLVTVAPLQWGECEHILDQINDVFNVSISDVQINQQPVAPQSEVTCSAGQSIQLAISICNLSAMPLTHLTLTIQFYQDYQNGVQNYRLDTRCTMSGPNQ
jgi:trafficking protein particle complex subunit 9